MERMERENAEVSGDEEEELAEEANTDESAPDSLQRKLVGDEDEAEEGE